MEKRFTFKDFFLFAFLALLFITLLLSMYMVDRQWDEMAGMQRTMNEQAEDLRALRGAINRLEHRLERGAIVSEGDAAGPSELESPAFARAQEATRQSDFARGDWLVDSFGTGLKTITPLVSSDAYASQVQSYVQESLLTRDPDTLEWVGMIARDWQVSDDGLSFTFRLREGVKFSDGEPLDADDVAFTFEFIQNPAIAAPRERAIYDKIESVTATGPHEVVFKFKEPYFNSLALAGGMAIMPRHFYEPYLDEPETFNQSKGLLLGSGPYRLADPKGWTPDQGLVELQRNPRYWGLQPSFDRVMWKVIQNDAARLTTFRNGDIDAYNARPREYQTLLDDKSLMSRSQRFEYMSPTAGYSYIGWNQQRNGKPTRFADPRVREAMTYLTDRQRIIDEIMLGYAEVAISPFNPRSDQHDPALEPRRFDLDRARRLLDEAGYRDRNNDGLLEGPDGEPFEFELVFFQDSEDTRRIVLFLKDLYARAGISLIPKPTEWSVMLDLINKRDFDAITLGWTSGVETDIYQIFHSKQIESGGDNFIGYKNEQLDRLIEQARGTVEETKRMPLWQEAERILHDDQPYTFLMRRESLVFIDERIKNLQNTNLGLNLGILPVEIYVPLDMQKYNR
ncbi:MAG: peptide-binding protein [Thiohalophilus sp.]|uniref:peptide-binding protein n=1 Tax=Thiohalophilus sp. TaxID=3028392 RepID=UPI00286FFB17|nr:peptide-binding protein [Thiohalophilus sp.]MDR9437514.1 peptide-binding protein [Thiohalophilus sp.]